jgi:hypothetical protein
MRSWILCLLIAGLPSVAEAGNCTPRAYWDDVLMDSLWVGPDCRLLVNPSYWQQVMDIQVSQLMCARELGAYKAAGSQYDGALEDYRMATATCLAQVANRDTVIQGLKAQLSLAGDMMSKRDTIEASYRSSLEDMTESRDTWRKSAIITLLVVAVETVLIAAALLGGR